MRPTAVAAVTAEAAGVSAVRVAGTAALLFLGAALPAFGTDPPVLVLALGLGAAARGADVPGSEVPGPDVPGSDVPGSDVAGAEVPVPGAVVAAASAAAGLPPPGAAEGFSGVRGPASALRVRGVSGVVVVGGDVWCVAGMTAPVRVNVGGRMRVWGGGACGCTGGAFPPYAGEHSGTLLTTHAYVYTQDRPRPGQARPVRCGRITLVVPAFHLGQPTCRSLFGEPGPTPDTFPEAARFTSAFATWAGVARG